MKKYFYLFVVVLLFMGCNTEKETPATEKENPSVADEETVVISLGSKFTVREEPLNDWTRAGGSNDLYGFQVWANEKGTEAFGDPKCSDTGNRATPVCCGVFDNLEENISAFLENSKEMTEKERVEARYQRFRSM